MSGHTEGLTQQVVYSRTITLEEDTFSVHEVRATCDRCHAVFKAETTDRAALGARPVEQLRAQVWEEATEHECRGHDDRIRFKNA